MQIGKKFHPSANEIPEKLKISLVGENVTTLIKMLEESGSNSINKEVNAYFRHLHELKYKIQAGN